MSYLLFLGMGSLTAIFRKNRVICSILVFLFWIAMTFNTLIADRGQYQKFYSDPVAAKEEWGYTQLQLIAKTIGLSFQAFFAIIIGAALLMILYTVLRASLNPGWTLVLYLIFPFTMDAAQVRSFVAAAFIATGLVVLAKDRSLSSIVKYLVLVTGGVMFHYSAIFFYLVVIAYFVPTAVLYLATTLFALFTASNLNNVIRFVGRLLPFIDYKIKRYYHADSMTAPAEIKGYTIYLILLSLLALIAWLMIRHSLKNPNERFFASKQHLAKINNYYYNHADLVIKVNALLMLALPLLSISVSFDRLIRACLLSNYILFANALGSKASWWVKTLFAIACLLFVGYYFNFYIYSRFPEVVFRSVFEQNLFLP
ncbi:EpsG family protein [Enterococcus dongliensis]|uniref:EpsG family protein n=1 Tax=Enterococcus dongliensis TaxID=2559925 RepID=UPI002890AED0|nr:EpsG family protein [Enterococcus dongliensis]MDT2674214.1 EpsG family protein [Enterococcus dongliensis]